MISDGRISGPRKRKGKGYNCALDIQNSRKEIGRAVEKESPH